MKLIQVPGLEFPVSRLIFGTANWIRAGSAIARQNLLTSAVEHGFTHFDTAPYYGFGMAERDLAAILKSAPNLTVTTKVGLYSPGGEEQPLPLILARKIAGRVVKGLAQPQKSFDLRRAERSLAGSLQRLGRDHIDIYLLHEPEVPLVDLDAWQQWLEQRKRAGLIRSFGLAGLRKNVEPFLTQANGLSNLIQTDDSLSGREADYLLDRGRPLQLTEGYESSPHNQGKSLTASEILTGALARNAGGAIVINTTRPEQVSEYSALPDAST